MNDRKSGGMRARPSSASRTKLPEIQTAARAPSPEDRAAAATVSLADADTSSVRAVMNALPDPSSLTPGTLVVVPAELTSRSRSLARSVLAVFGRAKTASRALRCSALVARGYVDVGSAENESGADLAWGYAPPR